MAKTFYCTYTGGDRYQEIHPTGWQRETLEEATTDAQNIGPHAKVVVSYDSGVTWRLAS